MKAVLLTSPHNLSITDIPKPTFKEGYALIKIKTMGICGSDVTAFRGTNPTCVYPCVIGHELAGVIEEIGENNPKHLKRGDRVAIYPFTHCGECYPCSKGKTNCCENIHTLGVHINGGMTEYILHPHQMLFKIPDNVPWEIASMAEPLAISLRALHRADVQEGQVVAINGAGPIGLLSAMAVKNVFHAVPVLIDPVTERLKLAQDNGIEHVVTPDAALEAISKLTNGRMAEVVHEASGANSAIRACLDMAAYTGTIVLSGWPKQETSLPTNVIMQKELNLLGARNSVGEIGEALELMATKTIAVEALLSKLITIDEVPSAVEELSEYPNRYMKINALIND